MENSRVCLSDIVDENEPGDCALSYGLVEYLRTLAMLKDHGWSPARCIPHGGHQMSLAIARDLYAVMKELAG